VPALHGGGDAVTTPERVALAILIVVLDVAVFVVPVTGLLAAWVLLARPPWFRQWVDRLYEGG
jgi:hypothetical protein